MSVIKRLRNATTSFIKEVSAFYRFFQRTEESRKRIVFYSEHEGYYPYYEGIINELLSGYNSEFCYITSSPSDPVLKEHDKRISAFYINKLLPLFMLFVNCRVFVITMTDLDNFHIKRSINTVKYVYVFHSLASTHMCFLEGAYDNYDIMLCPGRYHLKEIRRREEIANLPRKELIKAGYYRLERVHRNYGLYIGRECTSSEKTVLIAPSWGKEHILKFCGKRLVGILLESGYNVIVRPHPETVIREKDLVDSIEKEFGNSPKFTMERSVVTDESLLKADILISDYSGIALEYAFGTERPVMFVDTPPKIRNPHFKKLGMEPVELALRDSLGRVISPDEIENAPQIIDRLIAEKDIYKKRLAEMRNRYIYAFGHSSEIGAEYINKIAGYGDIIGV